MGKLFIFAVILLGCIQYTSGQNNRITTYNTIGWFNYFGTFKVADKFAIHTEYQWRRNDFVKSWQQSLLRVGVN
jgi:hypothetical protein